MNQTTGMFQLIPHQIQIVDNRLDMVKTQVILMIIPHPMETLIPMVDHLETLTLRLFPCLKD